jgi:hypothetical protein
MVTEARRRGLAAREILVASEEGEAVGFVAFRWGRDGVGLAEVDQPERLAGDLDGLDGQAEREREGDGRPIVGIARSAELLGVLGAVVVFGRGPPLDRHDLECGEQQRGVQAALLPQAWDVTGDLEGVGGGAAWRVRGGDDDPRAAADQRREDDVGVNDDGGWQRDRRGPRAQWCLVPQVVRRSVRRGARTTFMWSLLVSHNMAPGSFGHGDFLLEAGADAATRIDYAEMRSKPRPATLSR